jgi:hypothetical protein
MSELLQYCANQISFALGVWFTAILPGITPMVFYYVVLELANQGWSRANEA